jgi:hypothetical protein
MTLALTAGTAIGLACPGISALAALALAVHAIWNRRKNP